MSKKRQNNDGRRASNFRLEKLETRVLFSADVALLAGSLVEPPALLNDALLDSVRASNQTISSEGVEFKLHDSAHELVIIDSAVPDLNVLLADFANREIAPRVVVLEADKDALARIGELLSEEQGLSAVHLISHGADGELQLGGERINADELLVRAKEIAKWRSAFAADADFLIYGCDIAASADGMAFVDTLGLLTGTDVAASRDATGAAREGGNWQLEYRNGEVQSDVITSNSLQNDYAGTLATYLVTDFTDDATTTQVNTLRWAIEQVNAGSGGDIIQFSSNGTIVLDGALPQISQQVEIDATTVNTYSGTPVVSLDGSNLSPGTDGLRFNGSGADNSTVRGLEIINIPRHAIYVFNADGMTIELNYVGTDGTNDLGGSGGHGIQLNNSSNGTIGGVGKGNLISGNGQGLRLGVLSNNNVVQGNFIGTNASGDAPIGNDQQGIMIDASSTGNKIGGNSTLGEGNLVSGNGASGSSVNGILVNSSSHGTEIYGNIIGLDATGTFALANGNSGISVDNSTDVIIGSSAMGHGNIISGNGSHGIHSVDGDRIHIAGNLIGIDSTGAVGRGNASAGIYLDSTDDGTIGGTVLAERNVISSNVAAGIHLLLSNNNTLQRNYIGTSADGVSDMGNGADGVLLAGDSQNNLIGGTLVDQANTIRANAGAGISTIDTNSTGNAFLLNVISANEGLGIDLDAAGVLLNDNGFTDSDTGPNSLQNYPVLTRVLTNGSGNATVQGTVDSAANSDYRIDFYASTTGDSLGHGEAERFLGTSEIRTNGTGAATFSKGIAVANGEAVSATLTLLDGGGSPLGTSEFSANVVARSFISAPVLALTEENTAYVYSGANVIQVSDELAEDTRLQVSLSVSNGTLRLASLSGITFVEGADASSMLVIEGLESDINTALRGLQFTPDTNYIGGDVLNITTGIAADLEGYYNFDINVLDQSAGASNDGSLQLGASYVNDAERGNVLSLDGIDDHVVIAGNFDNPASVTLAGWVNLAAADTGGADFISLGDNIVLRLDDPTGGVWGSIYNGSVWNDAASNTYIAGTGWNHVAAIFNDASNQFLLYINGKEAASLTTTDSIIYTLGTETSIGRHGNGETNRNLNGRVDDVRVYSRALSVAEVEALAADVYSETGSVTITVGPINDAPKFFTPVAPGFTSNDIDTAALGALSVTTADVDDDGDLDVLSASQNDDRVAWYENLGNGSFTTHTIAADADGANTVVTADVDGDGDLDVLSSSQNDDKIAWYENDGSENFITQVISTNADYATSVSVADVDGDGDIDVLSAAFSDGKIVWYENNGSGVFTAHDAATGAFGSTAVDAADLDGDGDIDLLSSSQSSNSVTWYENDGSENFTANTITSSATGANSLATADIDGDGDLDVLSSAFGDNTIEWYQNDGFGVFTTFVIATNASGAISVATADLNGDGYMDVLSASRNDNKIAWYENDGSENFTLQVIATNVSAASSVTTGDIDGDGDLDVLSSALGDARIVWHESDLNTLDANPTYVENGFAVVLDSDVTVSDAELDALNGGNGNYTGATLTVERDGGADSDDVISFANGNGITLSGATIVKASAVIATFDTTTTAGQLVITFTSANGQTPTSADVHNILSQLTYENTNTTPPASVRINWTLDDGNAGLQGNGGAAQATGSTTVTITATNDAPVVTVDTGALAYTENSGAIAVSDGASVSDVDSANLSGAVVQITGGTYVDGEDVLAFTTLGAISGSFVSSTGTLTLSGSASVADYQAALRTITYENTSENPTTGTRTISFSVNDGESVNNLSAVATRDITITAINDTPVVVAPVSSLAANEQTNLAIDGAGFTLSDVDANSDPVTATLAVIEGTITIVEGDSGVTTNGSNGSSSVELTGTVLQIDNLLTGVSSGTITYQNTSDSPSTSTTFSVTVNDGGNTGSDPGSSGDGSSEQHTASQTIIITAINDNPTNAGSLPTDIAVTEDVSSHIDLSAVNFSDTDAASGSLTVTLSTTRGGELNTTAGTGITLAGTSTARTLTGTLGDLNNYFNNASNITYQHGTENISGSNIDTIRLAINDNHNTGAGGGTDQTLGSISIDITAVNDAPVDLIEERTFDQSVSINTGTSNNQYFASSDGLLGGLSDFTVKAVITQLDSGVNYWLSYGGSNDLMVGSDADTLVVWIDDVKWETDVSTALVADGNPHEWIISRSASDGEISLYIDGQSVAHQSGFTTGVSLVTGQILTLGQEQDSFGGDFDPTQIHKGDYADLAVYDTAWNATTVAENTGRISADRVDRIAHWNFDDLSGGLVRDQEGSSDLTLTTIPPVGGWIDGDAMVIGTAHDLSIPEHSANASTVTKITGLDPDAGAMLSYSIISQDVAGTFSIDSGNGIVTVANNGTLDFEATPTQNITVEVSDGALTFSETFTIQITPVNEAPVVNSPGSAYTVDEGVPLSIQNTGFDVSDVDSGTGTVTATMAVAEGTITVFAGTSGVSTDGTNGSSSVVLTGTVAQVNDVLTGSGDSTITYLNNSDTPVASTSISVTVNDGGNSGAGSSEQGSASQTINITAVNDAPTINSTNTSSVAENQTSISTVTSTDVDGGTRTYSITGGTDEPLFGIDSNTGVLSFNTARDFETVTDDNSDGVYEIEITADDGSGGTDTQIIAVTVTDVDESPEIVSNGSGATAAVSVAENQTSVTTVVATDDDVGDTQAYSLTGGIDQGAFSIDSGTGVISFNSAPNHETKSTYVVEVTVTDSDDLTDVQTLTVTVDDVNEAPVDLIDQRTFDQGVQINNGSANNQYFLAADGEGLLGGLSDFTVKGVINQTVLTDTYWLSYGGSNDLLIGSYDNGILTVFMGPSTWHTGVSSSLIADGEAHEWIISRSAADGTISLYIDGRLAASRSGFSTGNSLPTSGPLIFGQEQDSVGGDFESEQAHSGSYDDIAIYNTAWDAATVVANTGQISADTADRIAHWDFNDMSSGIVADQVSSRDLMLTTIMPGGEWIDGSAVVIGTAFQLTIPENSANTTIAGKITGIDVDAGDTLTYSISSQDMPGAFTIDSITGVVTVANSSLLDHEVTPSQSITVVASDGSLSISETFLIQITAVNETPSITLNTGLTITQGASSTITSAMLNASDVDNDDPALEFHITTAPLHGQVESTTNAGVALTSFTVQQILDAEIFYSSFSNSDADDSFVFEVRDGGEDAVVFPSATFAITVESNSVTATDDAFTMISGAPIVVDLMANDLDSQGDALSVIDIIDTAGGNAVIALTGVGDTATLASGTTLTLRMDGRLEVAAIADGTESFDYRVSDGLESDRASVTLNTTSDQATAEAIGFVTTWDTSIPGGSASDTLELSVNSGSANYTIFWGDGTSSTGVSGDASHTYAAAGNYTVAIVGDFAGFGFNSGGDADKLISIEQWGNVAFENWANGFEGARNLALNATDSPDLTDVTNLSEMFRDTTFNADISDWDVSGVENMNGLFRGNAVFNQDINTWDVSGVSNMAYMFREALAFNGDISDWNTSSLTNMSGMFLAASSFNNDIGNWNIGSVESMAQMFYDASVFNQDISGWETGNVTSMSQMFRDASAFNQNINTIVGGGNNGGTAWDVSGVLNMSNLFISASSFNGDINNWDTSSVTDMSGMFRAAVNFNSDISNWDTSAVDTMELMFFQAGAFNQNISSWETGSVESMRQMFRQADAFDQDINTVIGGGNLGGTSWDTSNVIDMYRMFYQAGNFNQNISDWNTGNLQEASEMFFRAEQFDHSLGNWDISSVTSMSGMLDRSGLSTENYDDTLIKWQAQSVLNGVAVGAEGLIYDEGAGDRQRLIDEHGWLFSDDAILDTDGDLVGDFYDLDDDNDGLLDVVELATVDTDGDGVVDRKDLDSDNDGLSDLRESGADALVLDTDGDGIINNAVFTDGDSDGLADVLESLHGTDTGTPGANSDSDGFGDYLDLDSDDDGIADWIEAQAFGSYVGNDGDITDDDLDGDGVIGAFDSNDGTSGTFGGTFSSTVDSDSDGFADYVDTDSDGDGRLDVVESGLSKSGIEVNADGIDDNASIGASYADPDGVNDDPATDINAAYRDYDNNAPLLDNTANLALTNQMEDGGEPIGASGTVITDLVSLTVNVSDVDDSAQTGVAITSADTIHGLWWYTIDSGTTWNALGSVSDTSARVLNADDNSRVYFQSNADFNGTINDALTFRAWDRSTGSNGSLQDASINGGNSAYSTVNDTADLTVTAVNDLPQLVGESIVVNGDFSSSLSGWTSSGSVDGNGAEVRFGQVSGANGTLSQTLNTQAGLTYVFSFDYGDRSATRFQALDVDVTGTGSLLGVSLVSGVTDNTLQTYHYRFVADSALSTITFTDTSANHSGVRAYLDNVKVMADAVSSPALVYTENEGARVIESMIDIVDIDRTNIESALVEIISHFVAGQDVLMFANQNGITGSFDSLTGNLTLSGSASQADYETALASITYENISDSPDTSTRTISFTVIDAVGSSNTQTRDITISSINDTPDVAGPETAYTVNEQTTLTIHGTGFSVSDADSMTATMRATVTAGEGAITVAEGGSGVVISSGNSTGTVVLSGSVVQLNNLLAGVGTGTITYVNGSDTPSALTTITVTINDQGNNGADPGLTGDGISEENAASQVINVTAVNDNPMNTGTLPADIVVSEDIISNIDLTSVELFDVDAGSANLTMMLNTDTGGELRLSADTNLTLGGTSAERTLSGTIADLNNYFNNASNISYLHGTANINGDDSDTITFLLSDNGNTGTAGGTTQTLGIVNVDITAINDAPVLGSIGDQLADEQTTLTFTATASDIDTPVDTLSYSIDAASLAVGMTIDPATGVFSWTPDEGLGGMSRSVTVTVSDNGAVQLSAAETFTITVRHTNHPPVLAPIGHLFINEGTTSIVTVSASDSDIPAQLLSYSLTGGTERDAFVIDSLTGELSLLVPADYESKSEYEVAVSVTDEAGLSDTLALTVSVNDVDEMPVAVEDELSTLEDTPLIITPLAELLVNDHNPEGAALRFDTFSQPESGVLIQLTDGLLEYQPATHFNGLDYFDYTVANTKGNTASARVWITVEPVNDPPVLSPGPVDGSSTPEGVIDASQLLNGVFAMEENTTFVGQVATLDIDGDEIRYYLAGTDAALFEINSVSGELTPLGPLDFESPDDSNHDNRYELTILVTDSSSSEYVHIPLTLVATDINEPPHVIESAFTAQEGFSGDIGRLQAVDLDAGDRLEFELSASSTGMQGVRLLPDGRLQMDGLAPGDYELEVLVRDSAGLVSIGRVFVTISPLSDNTPTIGAALPEGLEVDIVSGASEPKVEQVTVSIEPIAPDTETGSAPRTIALWAKFLGGEDVPAERGEYADARMQFTAPNKAIQMVMTRLELPQRGDTGESGLFLPEIEALKLPLTAQQLQNLIDLLRESLDGWGDDEQEFEQQVRIVFWVGSVTISVGVTVWLLSSQALLAAAFTTVTIWRSFDPLSVVLMYRKREESEGEPDDLDER